MRQKVQQQKRMKQTQTPKYMDKKNKKIIFPKESSDILYELLVKHKAIESHVMRLKRIEKNEESNARKTVILIRQIALGKIAPQKMESELKIRLGLTSNVAQKLSKELKEKILDTVIIKSTHIDTGNNLHKRNGSIPIPKKRKSDTYREPVT